MCAMQKELILDFDELKHISVTCLQCGAITTVDVTNEKMRPAGRCPSCFREFDSHSTQEAIAAFVEAYRKVSRLKDRIAFRITLESSVE